MTRFLVAAIATGLAGCASSPPPATTSPEAKLERGRYLVNALACSDCHTPWIGTPEGPAPDATRLLSGHPESVTLGPPPPLDPAGGWAWAGSATNTAYAGPWGVSYATNLTPDLETGLGVWVEATFVKSMRSGQHWKGDRPILPPMPWPAYAQLSDDDLGAIYAYLQSIPPIRNQVPDAALAPAPPG